MPESKHLTEENRETVIRMVNNLSRAQHGALDSDEALDQFLEDFEALVTEATTAPPPARKSDKSDDKGLKL
jgi:hypothetical protein